MDWSVATPMPWRLASAPVFDDTHHGAQGWQARTGYRQPGGARIITTVLQQIVNYIDYGMNPLEAAATPRFHHQWTPDELRIEKGFSADTVTLLRQWGHKVELKPSMGRTQTIEIRDGMLLGASDPRNPDGKTMGY